MSWRRIFTIILALFAAVAAGWWLRGRLDPWRTSSPSRIDAAVAGDAMRDPADAGPRDSAVSAAQADQTFNPGWIGAACGHDDDCEYEGGFCLLPEEGFARGYCSQRCQRLCPDRHGDLYSETFCMEDPGFVGSGICVARCNLHLTASGCRSDYVCSTVVRLAEETTRLVCLPDRGRPAPPTACTEDLRRRGLTFSRPDLADALSRAARAGGPRPNQDHCQVDTPVLLASPLHGVDFRLQGQRHAEHLLVACRFAPVLDALAKLLAEHGVVEAQHMGTFVCRSVAGTRSLSGHGRGLAIDLAGFERREGTPLKIQRDWSGADAERRRALRQLVRAIRDTKLFDVVLTPESNRAHSDHLHLEIRVRGGSAP